MPYNFDKIHPRGNTQSIKWDYLNSKGQYQQREVGENPLDPKELIPLGLADMDFPSPPEVIDALTARVQHGIFGYTSPSPDYYASIINWMKSRNEWEIQPEWLRTTSGVMPSINLLIQTLTSPGEGIIIQTPVFYPFYQAVEFNNRTLVRNPLVYQKGRYTMDFADLARKAANPQTKMMILCNPHNPVGRVWTVDELRRVGEICETNNLLLISDELHSDLTYSWAKFTSFGALDARFHKRLMVCTGPSKAFNLPGMKTALTIIPNEEIRDKFTSTLRNLNELFGANILGTLALQKAYEKGEEWLAQLLLYLEGNYRYLLDYFDEHLPQLNVVPPEALFLIWVDCRALKPDASALKEMLIEEAKVYVEAGNLYGAEGEGFIRINIATPRPILEAALGRMRDAIQKYG